MNNSDYSSTIFLYSVIWVISVLVYILFLRKNRFKMSGLSLIYIANLALIHFFGSVFFILPAYSSYNLKYTVTGFKYSTIALVCFVLGNIVYTKFSNKSFARQGVRTINKSKALGVVPLFFLLLGVLLYLLRSFVGQLPTLTVFLSIGFQLIVVAICLYSHTAYRKGDHSRIYAYVLLSFLIPVFIVLTEGFIGYGISMLISIIIFVDSFSKIDFKKAMVLVLLSYMGLSFYVNYITDRELLREAVWEGQPLEERIEEFRNLFEDFEFFNPQDKDHLDAINKRLNQNEIVGISVDYVNGYTGYFARGETYKLSIYNLIPRIIWKDKPITAGNTALVEEYTGLRFMGDTSVGMPQVMEMYINFGMTSLVLGFLFIGAFFSYLDMRAGFYLQTLQYEKFVLYFLPPLAFMRSETPTTECLATFVASFGMVYLFTKTAKRHLKPIFMGLMSIVLLVGLLIFYLPTIDPLLSYMKYLIIIAVIVFIILIIGKKQKRY